MICVFIYLFCCQFDEAASHSEGLRLVLFFREQFPTLNNFCPLIVSEAFIAYRIVASRSMSWLVTRLCLFRLLMKGIFGPYVL